MIYENAVVETTEYRVIFVQPDSRKVLALDAFGKYRLPTVRILQWTRPAEQLRLAIKTAWSLHILVLEVFSAQGGSPCCAVVEVLMPNSDSELKSVTLTAIEESELPEEHRGRIASLLCDDTDCLFSRVGWIDQAVAWLEMETGRRLSSKNDIEQYNAGGAFSLIRFRTQDEGIYWMKATGEPNTHELTITSFLSELGGDYLPKMISCRPKWNAWLMSGDADQVTELPSDPLELFRLLDDAVKSMAKLQLKTKGRSVDLLEAGAFDQGIHIFQRHYAALFDYLQEAMASQTSTKVPRLETARLHEICLIFEDVCRRVADLDLPQTIIHGDMNHANILVGGGHCQFIDWCEAYVGNPLITLQHLLLFNRVENPEIRRIVGQLLKDKYKGVWQAEGDPLAIDDGFVYMPLLAVASSLYGRGDWLNSVDRNAPHFQKYARNLARHMDQAARAPELLDALRC